MNFLRRLWCRLTHRKVAVAFLIHTTLGRARICLSCREVWWGQ